MKHASVLAIALSTSCQLMAQSFNYGDFNSVTGLTLNGNAVQSTNVVRLTNNIAGHVGSLFYSSAVPVSAGFETTFRIRATSSVEGFAFVIHNGVNGANSVGGDYWGLGYGFGNSTTPIGPSLAIEFDNVVQGFLNDTDGNELSIHSAGPVGNTENEGASLARITPGTDFADGQLRTVRVTFIDDQLEVFLDDLNTPVLTTTWSFDDGGTLLNGGQTGGLGLSGIEAFVGITGSNPAANNQNIEVVSWSWESFALPPDCYNGNVLAGTTGPHDVLTVDNSTGGYLRTVRKTIGDPFSFQVEPPPGEANAPFVLFATLGAADDTFVTPTIYGDACFPLVAVLDIGGFLAPYQVQVPPGIQLPFPFTFQAVMATDSLNPGQLELTNAVALNFLPGLAPVIASVNANSAPVGTLMTISGLDFSPFATLTLNGAPLPTQSVAVDQIQFLMPANVGCDSTLAVVNPDGQMATIPFNASPVINNQVNSQGPAAGNTLYVAIGTGFAPGSTATVGGQPATIVNSTNTTVVMYTPPGTPGPAPIVITTPGGCTVTSTFTYL